MTLTRRYVAAIFFCSAALSMWSVSAPTFGASRVTDRLGALAAYAGKWDANLTYVKTAYSNARSEHTVVSNDCWRTADYYACHQFVAGKSAALLVYTYDQKSASYVVHVVPADTTAGSAPGTLTIHGNVWTFPWRIDEHGKPVYFRVVNVFRDARTIEFSQSYSFDRTHWIATGSGIEHRVS